MKKNPVPQRGLARYPSSKLLGYFHSSASRTDEATLCAKPFSAKRPNGFSLFELIVAMTITLAVMAGSSTLLSRSFAIRSRENRKSDGLADVQRAFNLMSRELAVSGFGLYDNGIVAGANDSNQTAIHFRTNLNNTNATTTDADEDVAYIFQPASFSIMRYDRNSGTMTELASRIDSLQLTYHDLAGNVLNVAASPQLVRNATGITLTFGVTLPPINGVPAFPMSLTSEITLRNAPETLNRY